MFFFNTYVVVIFVKVKIKAVDLTASFQTINISIDLLISWKLIKQVACDAKFAM